MDKKKTILAVCLVFIAASLPVHSVKADPCLLQIGQKDFDVTQGQSLTVNFNLTAQQTGTFTLEFYGDQMADWDATLLAGSLSLTAGTKNEISLDVIVDSAAVDGTHGGIMQVKYEGKVTNRWNLFLDVNREKMLVDNPRVDRGEWISGENFPRELHLPYKYDIPVYVWVKRLNETYQNFWVDVDKYVNGKFYLHKCANFPVSGIGGVGSEGRTKYSIPLGDGRQYDAANYTYVIFLKHEESFEGYKGERTGVIETVSVNSRSYCPGVHPPLTTLSLNVQGSSTSSNSDNTENTELEQKVSELEDRLTLLNSSLSALNASLCENIDRISDLALTLKTLNEEFSNIDFDGFQASLLEVNRSLSALEGRLHGKLGSIQEALDTTASSLNQNSQAVNEQITELSRQIAESNRQIFILWIALAVCFASLVCVTAITQVWKWKTG